jgi:broad specificity phosphatase PhoE
MSQRDAVVYLIRHGQTGLNAAGVLRGRLDPPLDEVGAAEAAALGLAFGTVPLVAVVTSPLRRARQTGARIAEATGVPLAFAAGLLDRDYGRCAGQSLNDVVRHYGSLDAAPGVELADVFAARTVAAVRAIATRWAPGPVAVVAHDAVNRQVLACLCPELGVADAIGQRTGCWNRLERGPSGWAAPIVNAVPDDGRRP